MLSPALKIQFQQSWDKTENSLKHDCAMQLINPGLVSSAKQLAWKQAPKGANFEASQAGSLL